MQDGVSTEAVIDTAKHTVTSGRVLQMIVERRIEVLLGTLIAYQIGMLDQLVAAGQQCIA
jgi:hypothetical protein